MENESNNPVEKAIKAAGGRAIHLAKKLGVTHQAISVWMKNKQIPLNKVIKVSEVTGVPKYILRPDFFK